MSEQKSVYSNAQAVQKLSDAFKDRTSQNIPIPQRNCQDVPEFIRRLQSAQDATRKHTIKFD